MLLNVLFARYGLGIVMVVSSPIIGISWMFHCTTKSYEFFALSLPNHSQFVSRVWCLTIFIIAWKKIQGVFLAIDWEVCPISWWPWIAQTAYLSATLLIDYDLFLHFWKFETTSFVLHISKFSLNILPFTELPLMLAIKTFIS